MLDDIAASLGVDPSTMKIVSITDARRRILAVSIQVEVIAADDQSAQALARRTADVAAAAEAAAKQNGLDTTVSATSSASTLVPVQRPTATTTPSPVMSTPVSLTGTLSAAEEEPEPARSQRVFVGAVAGTLSLLTVLMAYAVMYRLRRSGAQTGKQLDVEQDSDLQVNQRALDLSHVASDPTGHVILTQVPPASLGLWTDGNKFHLYTEVPPPSNGPVGYTEIMSSPNSWVHKYTEIVGVGKDQLLKRPVLDPPARTHEVEISMSDKPPTQGLSDLWAAVWPAAAAADAKQPERHAPPSFSSATSMDMFWPVSAAHAQQPQLHMAPDSASLVEKNSTQHVFF